MEERPEPGEEPSDELSPEAQALAEQAAEIRRMVEEGAGSPEALRELAARLREHRAREEELWRTAVKPVLVQQGKGRLRGHAKPVREDKPAGHADSQASQMAWLGGGMLAMIAVVLLAANTTVWVLVAPVVALLAWAWHQGRDVPPGA
jgi:hypothetical protein